MQRLGIFGMQTASLVVCAPLVAFAPGAAGNRELTVTRPQGPSTMTMMLTQSGSGVAATMSSPFCSSQITGTVSEADVTLTADIHTHPTIPRTARVSLHVGF